MRKILFVPVLILFVIVARTQQPPPPPGIEEKMKKTRELLDKEVQPDAQQKVKIETVYRKFFAAEEKLHKQQPPVQGEPPSPPGTKTKEAMDKLVKERDESVKKILNDKQYEKYKAAVKKLRPPVPGKNDHKPPPPRPQ